MKTRFSLTNEIDFGVGINEICMYILAGSNAAGKVG